MCKGKDYKVFVFCFVLMKVLCSSSVTDRQMDVSIFTFL